MFGANVSGRGEAAPSWGGGHFPVRKSLIVIVVAAGALWLAWQIIAVAISDYFAFSDPETALAWNSEQLEALQRIAEDQSTSLPDQASGAALADLARRIMSIEPLSGFPFRVLASLAEANNDDVRAESLMRVAGTRTLRDVRGQMWLADDELSKKNYEAALAHIDALLRVWPSIGEALFPVLADLAIQPDSANAVSEL